MTYLDNLAEAIWEDAPIRGLLDDSVYTKLESSWRLEELTGIAYDAFGRLDINSDTPSPSGVSGKVGNARSFVAATSHSLTRPSSAVLTPVANSWEMAGWARFDSATSFPILIAKGVSGTSEFVLYLNSGEMKIHFELVSDTDDSDVTHTAFGVLSTGTYYFVDFGYDSVAGQIFIGINDVFNTAVHTTGSRNAAGEFKFGHRTGGTFLDGKLDEIVRTKVGSLFTTTERTSLYAAGVGRSVGNQIGKGTDRSYLIARAFWEHVSRTLTGGESIVPSQYYYRM